MDDNLPLDMEEILRNQVNNAAAIQLVEEIAAVESDSLNRSLMYPMVASTEQETIERNKKAGLDTLKSLKAKVSQNKHHDKHVVPPSIEIEMLKLRALFAEILKQQGVYNSIAPKAVRSNKNQQPVNRQLETFDDFVDEEMEIDALANGRSNGDANQSRSSKISQQLTLRPNKRKVIAGDDDIPKRDDIGKRRRKHELRVLAGAGIKTGSLSSDGAADANEESGTDSDLVYYEQVERKRAARIAEKSAKYSRTPEIPSLPQTVDGKRHINNQIEKNRGLTRSRKKLTKNPRKKYKSKHIKAQVCRKGQVPGIRKPRGSYVGEPSGINPSISRSVRF